MFSMTVGTLFNKLQAGKYLCTANIAVSLVETLAQLLAHELNY